MGFTRRIDLDYDIAVTVAKAALQEQGFGILTEIDIARHSKTSSMSTPTRKLILGATRSSPTEHSRSTTGCDVPALQRRRPGRRPGGRGDDVWNGSWT